MSAPRASWLSTSGPLRAAVQPWRFRGTTWITVVLKASCRLVDGLAVGVEPKPLAFSDAQSADGTVVVHDLAPYKPRAEILVSSSAANVASAGAFGIGIERDGNRVWYVRADAERGAPFARLGWGPLATSSQLRRRHLVDGRDLDWRAPILDLGDQAPWMFLQVAPETQWLDTIAPGDTVIVERPGAPRVRSRLPSWHVTAALAMGGSAPRRFPLKADTIDIDVDAAIASIVWRGALEVPEADLTAFLAQDPSHPLRLTASLENFRMARPSTLALDAAAMAAPVATATPIPAFLRNAAPSSGRVDKSATPWAAESVDGSRRAVVPAASVSRTLIEEEDEDRLTALLPELTDSVNGVKTEEREPVTPSTPAVTPSPPPPVRRDAIATPAISSRAKSDPASDPVPRDPEAPPRAAPPAPAPRPTKADVGDLLRGTGISDDRVARMLARLHPKAEAPPPDDD